MHWAITFNLVTVVFYIKKSAMGFLIQVLVLENMLIFLYVKDRGLRS